MNDMIPRNPRQRRMLYDGIADMPRATPEQAIERFEHGHWRKPITATAYLLHEMHRHMTRGARRPLPGASVDA